MDALSDLIDSQTVLLIAAISIAFLLVRLLSRLLSGSLGMIIAIVAIVLVLQYVFGISPRQLWFEISHLPQDFARLLKGWSQTI